MSQTKKQKRAARLKAMVPISVLSKQYQMSQSRSLTNCNKEYEDFLCQSDMISSGPEQNSSGQGVECDKNDSIASIIEYDPTPSKDDLQIKTEKTTEKVVTIKRGRLKRKEIALNPDLYAITKPKNSDEPPKFTCTVCEKGFYSVTKLQVHYQCHLPKEEKEALKKFHCDYCPRTFKELNKLNTHRSFKHLKEYKFICEICGKPFINSSELKRHATFSHTEKQACTICGKQVLNIDIHYKEVHENIPKTCAICMKVFPNQKKLNKHRYVKHPFQIFECEICEKTYSERFCYKKHMADRHGIAIHDLIY